MRKRTRPGRGVVFLAVLALAALAVAIVWNLGQRPQGVDLSKYATPAPSPLEAAPIEPVPDTTGEPPPEASPEPSPEQAAESRLAEASDMAIPEPAEQTEDPPEQAPQEPATAGFDWVALTMRSDLWPERTRLVEPVDFPLVVDGGAGGMVRLPAGSEVRLVSVRGDQLEIGHGEGVVRVDASKTTIEAQLEGVDLAAESRKAATATPTPAGHAVSPTAIPPNRILPVPGWEKQTGGDLAGLEELLRILRPLVRPSTDLDATDTPEIFAGVRLLMPLAKALEQTGLHGVTPPPRSAISHPGIPFFYRSFEFRPSPASPLFIEGKNPFNRLDMVTDANDRVVALQLSSLKPGESRPADSSYSTYNFIHNRKKGSKTLKVGCDVESTDGLIIIETWVFDERRETSLEVVRLYLPRQVAGFLRHVTETRISGR